MPIIDAQVHAYEHNHPGRPWQGVLAGPEHATADEMVAAMDAVGVDGAILVSPFSFYGYDASYALECHAAHPGRFGLVKPVDSASPAVGEVVADWAATKGAVGIRIMLQPRHSHRSGGSRASPGRWRRRRSMPCRSTSFAGDAWIRPRACWRETPTR